MSYVFRLVRLRVKTPIQRGGAERPAVCDLIRGNKAYVYVCFYPKGTGKNWLTLGWVGCLIGTELGAT
jgi:hypothetical protein